MTFELRLATVAGRSPRLLRTSATPESLDDYRADGGYAALPDPHRFLGSITDSGLRGRGGAAFPLGRKIAGVREHCGQSVVPVAVANGEEGEPASVKDRWLLRNRPHLVLDGLRLAAHTVGADRAVIYFSDSVAAQSISAAIAEAPGGPVPIEVHIVERGYVAGEETAVVRAINGGPAKPTDKPPRPFQSGVEGRPTLVSNVETLANLPLLLRDGVATFRATGTETSTGTFLSTVTGAGPVGLYELPHGIPFTEVLALHGVSPDNVRGALMGGYFGGVLNRRILDSTLDYEAVRALGSGLGCGAVTLFTETTCPVAVAASVMAYFDRENAAQCGSCFNGTAAMSAVLTALRDNVADDDDLNRLRRWSTELRGRGACGTLDGAAILAASLLDAFPDEVRQHRTGSCEICATAPYSALRPFEVEAVEPV